MLRPVESGTATVGELCDSNPDIRDIFRLGHLRPAGSDLERAIRLGHLRPAGSDLERVHSELNAAYIL